MDKMLFLQALNTYHPEQTKTIYRPDGLFFSNTGSEVLEFELQNTVSPPFRVHILESNEPPHILFKLDESPPEEQRDILAAISGQSKQDLIVGFKISKTNLVDFYCARLGKTTSSRAKDGPQEPTTSFCHIPLSDTVQRLRLMLEYGVNTAYLLEQSRSVIPDYSRAIICQTTVTEVIGMHKTRRFTHTHISNQLANQIWLSTDYIIDPT